MATPKWTLGLLAILIVTALPACALVQHDEGQTQPDWPAVQQLLTEADQTLLLYRDVVDDLDKRERIERVRALTEAALASVDARIERGEGDPSGVIRDLISIAGDVIRAWPNDRERTKASLVYQGLRLSLIAAGVRL